MIHTEPHPLAGQAVNVTSILGSVEVVVEDWADRVFGQSWGTMNGNPVAVNYAMRAGFAGIPADDDVLYVKVYDSGFGLATLVHVSELQKQSDG